MKRNKVKSIVLLIFIILLFILLFFCTMLLQALENKEIENTNTIATESEEQNEKDPIKEVLEKYNAKCIEQKGSTVFVEFDKDLFEKNGSSNEKYFVSIIDEIKPFFENESFYLIDNEKDIYIFIKYLVKDKKHSIVINDTEDFFEKVDGEAFVAVEDAEIVKATGMVINEYYLTRLSVNEYYFKSIEDKLGYGKELENGYISFLDGKVELRKIPTGGVRNFIITDKYETSITPNITTETSLKEIKELFPENAFGSLSEDYLGYRQSNYYIFFYDNEVSVYPYSYTNNKTFEKILKTYIENRDLEEFVDNLTHRWMAYDYLEYNPENNSARILYSTRGISIDIKDNDPKGITFYDNYHFTDYTETLVKTGVVSFKPGRDLVELTENERRKGN